MRIVCPHCQAAYRVDALPEGAVLICHRCKGRFTAGEAGETGKSPRTAPEEQLPLFEAGKDRRAPASRTPAFQPANDAPAAPPPFLARKKTATPEQAAQPTTAEKTSPEPAQRPAPAAPREERIGKERIPLPGADGGDKPQTDNAGATADCTLPPPLRRGPRIWPWLAAMLLLIAGAGFYVQKDRWLANPALRGMLANLHLPLPPRDDDWLVEPASVMAQWIKREDGSQVLVIEGKVRNRLPAELPPPAIEIVFFDPDAPDRILDRRLMPITAPPTLAAIRRAPWSPPPADIIPVPPRGERAFVLVLERLPEQTGDFTLLPRARTIRPQARAS